MLPGKSGFIPTTNELRFDVQQGQEEYLRLLGHEADFCERQGELAAAEFDRWRRDYALKLVRRAWREGYVEGFEDMYDIEHGGRGPLPYSNRGRLTIRRYGKGWVSSEE